jgi:hypothetical protein
MSQKCSQCGAILSSYNATQVCYPCQKKRKDTIVEKIITSKGERLEYLDYLLGTRAGEKTMCQPQKLTASPLVASSGLRIQSGGPGSNRGRQNTAEIKKASLPLNKPKIQISLHPSVFKRPITARPAADPGIA